MIIRPMLAASDWIDPTLEGLQSLQFPLWVTPKLDGIRCLIGPRSQKGRDTTPRTFSRRMKKIPNQYIQDWVEDHLHSQHQLDGELILPNATFHETQSWVMTKYAVPKLFEYHVFDCWSEFAQFGYLRRLQILQRYSFHMSNLKLVLPIEIKTPEDLLTCFEDAINVGHEGLILRSSDGPYKQGRSTLLEGYMLKLKQWKDAEAEIIGLEPLYENNNPQETDETGYSKRSSHKANLKTTSKLGALLVRDVENERTFKIGSGFTEHQRVTYWGRRKELIGTIVTYKYQVQGEKDKPRSPIFKSFYG